MPVNKSISIVIPCYNEGEKLLINIKKIIKYLNKINIDDYEIIAVNDGSIDKKTNEIFRDTKIDKTNFIGYNQNKGKGAAVKTGIEFASKDIIIFMDADLSTDISAIQTVLDNIENKDIIIGSRHHKKTIIPNPQPPIRQFIGRCCIIITSILTGLNVKDTQCGFKAFKRDIAKKIITKQQINRWAFDVEYLYIAKINGFSIYEIPIKWNNDNESTVSPIKSSINFFIELIKIVRNKRKYKIITK